MRVFCALCGTRCRKRSVSFSIRCRSSCVKSFPKTILSTRITVFVCCNGMQRVMTSFRPYAMNGVTGLYTRVQRIASASKGFSSARRCAADAAAGRYHTQCSTQASGAGAGRLFNDQLVNPALKNILLAPEHYLPQQQQLNAPIEWSGALDESQKRVVELALRERNIALIQGPPGAGKTTAIVEMLYQLFRRRPNVRVLVVSQQNTAVDNALSKFLSQHAETFDQPVRTIRIGNPEKMSSAIKPLGFDSQYTDYLAELDARAVHGAVSLPREQAELCHKWLCMIRQTTQSRAAQDEFSSLCSLTKPSGRYLCWFGHQ